MEGTSKKPKLDGGESSPTDVETEVVVVFTLEGEIRALIRALKIFEEMGINISHIESRYSQKHAQHQDFFAKCDCSAEKVEELREKLSSCASSVQVKIQTKDKDLWFPRHIKDLDRFANEVLEAGAELKSDHPGFNDPVYRERRKYFEDLAKNYKHGQLIPTVEYTQEEITTWGTIFRELTKLYPTHACKEHNQIFPLLVEVCGYREDNIPQLRDISEFLKERSGFQLRPVAGLLSPRDFLAGLAFRVFHSTQYLRHGSKPMYTPEPDVCHELLGHVPLLCDPSFAQFSQEIGLASLGAPDEYIKQLSTLYWFTIEFGLCQQDGKVKAYGAGLLSSFGELQHCLTEEPDVRPLDPFKAALQEYPITTMQPIYFLADSFENAKQKLSEFAKTIPRPTSVQYDPYTQSVKVINNLPSIRQLFGNIKDDMDVLKDAVERFQQ